MKTIEARENSLVIHAFCRVFAGFSGRIRTAPEGTCNTRRGLTHSLVRARKGLAMNATRNVSESWKPVPGWEGFYEASTHGRIKSLARVVQRGGRPMKVAEKVLGLNTHHSGYMRAVLSKDGIRTEHLVHVVIALTFHGPRPEGMEILHGEGGQFDNSPSNLRYGTSSENSFDTVAQGNHELKNRTHCPAGHPLLAPNLVAAEQKLGHRKCRACNSAHAYVYRHTYLKGDFQSVSDEYFEKYWGAAA